MRHLRRADLSVLPWTALSIFFVLSIVGFVAS